MFRAPAGDLREGGMCQKLGLTFELLLTSALVCIKYIFKSQSDIYIQHWPHLTHSSGLFHTQATI